MLQRSQKIRTYLSPASTAIFQVDAHHLTLRTPQALPNVNTLDDFDNWLIFTHHR